MAIGTPTIGTFTEQTTAAGTTAVPYPSVVNANDCLVLVAANRTSGAAGITNPAGWTQVAQLSVNANTTLPDLYVGIKIAAGTEGGTSLTVTHSSAIAAFQILAFSGVDTTTPQDVAATTVDSAAALTCVLPGVTIATAGAALVAVSTQNSTGGNATPPTSPGTFTETGDRSAGTAPLEASYLLGVGTGATGNVTITWAAAVRNVGVLLALRPASTGVTGTLATTLAGATLAAAGTETFTGTLATTLAGATLAASGTETFTGTLATTLAGATFAGVGSETFTGTLAATLAGATLAGVGTETFTGTLATTLSGASFAASGTEKFTGTLAVTLAGATLAGVGTVAAPVTGTLAVTLAGATFAAIGTVGTGGPVIPQVLSKAAVYPRTSAAVVYPRASTAGVLARTSKASVQPRTSTASALTRTSKET